MPASRPSSDPCEVASSETLRSPASSMARNARWRSIASGVVRTAGFALPADPALDGAHQPGPPAGGFEDRVEEVGRGGLTRRSRDARDLELSGRVVEEGGRGGGHRGTRVLDDDLRHRDGQLPLDRERHCAALDRGGGEVVPVGARPWDAEEERTRPDAPRRVRQVRDLHRVVADDLLGRERRTELAQLHRPARLASVRRFDDC